MSTSRSMVTPAESAAAEISRMLAGSSTATQSVASLGHLDQTRDLLITYDFVSDQDVVDASLRHRQGF